MTNMEQESFFRAIEEQNIQLVQEMLEKGVKVNALSLCGTALYRSVKLNNFEISKLLVEKGADCNIVQPDFGRNEKQPNDGLTHSCFISTPIDFLCVDNEVINDELLKYLLENRPMVSEDMVDQRIRYCNLLSDDENHDTLFDYVASCFLRKNMYDHLYPLGPNALLAMVAATLNINASLQNEPLNEGGTHEAFFTLTIRSLFEELVCSKLRKSSNIKSEQQYRDILRELLHNLEAYNLLMDICCIPHERFASFYPSIATNIVNKLKSMKVKEEYTLPMQWDEHAVCVNFVRESDSIAIRIDNLNMGETRKHSTYKNKDNFFVMIPKIIGEIPLDKLDHNKDYFESLVICMKQTPTLKKGIETLYHNNQLEYLDTNRVSMIVDQLEEQSKTLKCFIQQAESNCFIKSHEPGFAIRSNNSDIFEKIITTLRVYTTKLIVKSKEDIVQKRNEFEASLLYYCANEPTTGEYVSGRIVFVKNRPLEKSYGQRGSYQNYLYI